MKKQVKVELEAVIGHECIQIVTADDRRHVADIWSCSVENNGKAPIGPEHLAIANMIIAKPELLANARSLKMIENIIGELNDHGGFLFLYTWDSSQSASIETLMRGGLSLDVSIDKRTAIICNRGNLVASVSADNGNLERFAKSFAKNPDKLSNHKLRNYVSRRYGVTVFVPASKAA